MPQVYSSCGAVRVVLTASASPVRVGVNSSSAVNTVSWASRTYRSTRCGAGAAGAGSPPPPGKSPEPPQPGGAAPGDWSPALPGWDGRRARFAPGSSPSVLLPSSNLKKVRRLDSVRAIREQQRHLFRCMWPGTYTGASVPTPPRYSPLCSPVLTLHSPVSHPHCSP